jgi:flavin reductase (DIM6/NTAB) family NADH-FMN oxidoreductase RutF
MENQGELLREVMRHWVSGVSVVTSCEGKNQTGMTVSSLASISIDPPLILVNLAIGTPTEEMVKRTGVFGVTLLGEEQQELSNLFAGYKKTVEDRFSLVKTFTLESGVPFIEGGLAFMDCKIFNRCELPKSVVLVGAVIASRVTEIGSPLVYLNRHYVKVVEN